MLLCCWTSCAWRDIFLYDRSCSRFERENQGRPLEPPFPLRSGLHTCSNTNNLVRSTGGFASRSSAFSLHSLSLSPITKKKQINHKMKTKHPIHTVVTHPTNEAQRKHFPQNPIATSHRERKTEMKKTQFVSHRKNQTK